MAAYLLAKVPVSLLRAALAMAMATRLAKVWSPQRVATLQALQLPPQARAERALARDWSLPPAWQRQMLPLALPPRRGTRAKGTPMATVKEKAARVL